MSLIKDMGGLRYISFASIVAIFYTLVVLVVELPAYFNQNFKAPTYEMVYACFDLNIVIGASVTFFAYTC